VPVQKELFLLNRRTVCPPVSQAVSEPRQLSPNSVARGARKNVSLIRGRVYPAVRLKRAATVIFLHGESRYAELNRTIRIRL
jgi:hypothetical protein